ncbi:DUF4406 domain-containing protein [Bacteroidetes/Chlorobi group bacterium Naka2016]|jgi:hypothetical protein|nr:MAG: DUF4406 domain-containing protein [Bacteroidetes/Chlorobi group bacterium Naka2016]
MRNNKLERLHRVISLYAKVAPDMIFDRSRRTGGELFSSRGVKALFALSAIKLGYKPSDIARFRGITQIDLRGMKKLAFGLDGEDWENLTKQVLSMFRKKIVYLAGKVSGLDSFLVKTKFKEAEDVLTELGCFVVNPTKILPEGTSWNHAMRTLIPVLICCDSICMLSDWEQSEGAKLEYDIAMRLGIEIFFFEDLVAGTICLNGYSRRGSHEQIGIGFEKGR